MINNDNIMALSKAIELGLSSSASGGYYYSDIAMSIQEDTAESIHLVPNNNKEFKGIIQTWSRLYEARVYWPETRKDYRAEHFIFYDEKLSPAKAARGIAHELYHIKEHSPTVRDVGENHRALYTSLEEKRADAYSITLLARHPYKANQAPPRTMDDFVSLLEEEAGWPGYLGREEALVVIKEIYER